MINDCRIKLGDVEIGESLDKVRYAMGMVHYAREADQADAMIAAVNLYLENELKIKSFVRRSEDITSHM